MAGFGGAIKLTGASEYQATLSRITQNIKENTSAMTLLATQYDKTDRSEEAVTARTKALSELLATQTEKLRVLQSQYENLAPRVQEQADRHKALVDRYEEEKRKLSDLENTLGKSSAEYKAQQAVVEDLAYEVGKSTNANEQNEKSLSALRTQMNQVQAEANATADKIKKLGDETEDAGEEAEKSAKGGWSIFKQVLADLSTKAITSVISGLQTLGSKLVEIGRQSVASYGEFEQQVGGVNKIFDQQGGEIQRYFDETVDGIRKARQEYELLGQEAERKTGAEMVLENAQNAFKTVGLSATEYMTTVTSFSASLMQGLGDDTVKASEVADLAMRDMADNVNAFGTSMESVRSAYAGFAKDNYTMLDNLKLGYGGNATEMARLINDSKVLGDSVEVTAKTVKDVPFDKIIEAIHVIQSEVGIMGTTSYEASNTIQGSTRAMQASWQNLIVGMADDNADFARLVDDFMSTLDDGNGGGAINQILPRVTTAINGISKALQTLVPNLVQSVAPMILNNLPTVLKAVTDALRAIMDLLPTIMPTIQALIPQVVNELVSNLPMILDTGIKIILALVNGIIESLPILLDEMPTIINQMIDVINQNLPLILKAGIKILYELAKGIANALPQLVETMLKLADCIMRSIADLIRSIPDAGWNIVRGLFDGIQSAQQWLRNKLRGWIGDITSFIKNLFGIHSPSTLFRDEIGENLALGIGEGFSDEMDKVSKEMASAIPTSFDVDTSVKGAKYGTSDLDIVSAFKEALSQMTVVMDDEQMGRFVERTVTQAIYA